MKRKMSAAALLIALIIFFTMQGMGERDDVKFTPAADSVSYRIDTITLLSDDSLVSLYISYPVITEDNRILTNMLNGAIEPILYTLLFPDYNQDALLVDQIHNHFSELVKEHKSLENSVAWYFNEEVSIVHNKNGVISTSFATDLYTGGAHGNHSVLYLSTEYGKTNREITLTQLFPDDVMDEVNDIGEKYFRKARGMNDTVDLTREGFWLDNGKFRLTDNFAIVPDGMIFHYNSYSIAPYAMGETAVHIPFDDFAPLLNKRKQAYWE